LKEGRNMKWALCFLVSLLLATACVVEDKPVADAGTGGTGGTAGDAGNLCGCPDDRPVCIEDTQTCVECTPEDSGACDGSAPVCDPDSNTCICRDDDDCTDPAAAKCNAETRTCRACDDSTQCDGVTGLDPTDNVCNSEGVCVDCTVETEAETCPEGDSCHPTEEACTGVPVGSLRECDACVADSQCGDGTSPSLAYRCVPLNYQQQRYPDESTGFCLKSIELGGSCNNPFRIVVTRPSLSGEPPDAYCGINEGLTTCDAVQALIEDAECNPENGDDDCPQPAGLCRELPGALNRCTYRCASIVECIEAPAPGSSCANGDGTSEAYCGG
jgi:hypothetical protein